MSSSPDIRDMKLRRAPGAQRKNPLRSAPNLLTLLRICMTPFLLIAVVERRFVVAFLLFVLAACTDAIDGLLARWLQQQSLLGEYLDPVADKLMLSSLFLLLTYMGILEPRVAVLVFGRDLGMLLTALILYATTSLRDFHPSRLGKANSFSQVLAVGMVLLSLIYRRPWVLVGRDGMLDLTMLLTVLSGFHYAWVASRRIGLATAPQNLETSFSMRRTSDPETAAREPFTAGGSASAISPVGSMGSVVSIRSPREP
jgi:cardiolipin synthase